MTETIVSLIDGQQYITGKRMAELLDVNPITIYRAIDAGKLEAKKLGNTWYISKTAYETYTAVAPWPGTQAEPISSEA